MVKIDSKFSFHHSNGGETTPFRSLFLCKLKVLRKKLIKSSVEHESQTKPAFLSSTHGWSKYQVLHSSLTTVSLPPTYWETEISTETAAVKFHFCHRQHSFVHEHASALLSANVETTLWLLNYWHSTRTQLCLAHCSAVSALTDLKNNNNTCCSSVTCGVVSTQTKANSAIATCPVLLLTCGEFWYARLS